MDIRLARVMNTKQILRRSSVASNHEALSSADVPKGHLAVYVGENQKKRYIVPISLLSQTSFQELLSKAEEGFRYDHPMGSLTIPCRENIFLDVVSGLNLSLNHI